MKGVYSLARALGSEPSPNNLAAEIARCGTVDVEFYQPRGEDRQKPHDRDELYVVARGSGGFEQNGERSEIRTGDVIYVRAHDVHRFVDFSGDFAAWVFFY